MEFVVLRSLALSGGVPYQFAKNAEIAKEFANCLPFVDEEFVDDDYIKRIKPELLEDFAATTTLPTDEDTIEYMDSTWEPLRTTVREKRLEELQTILSIPKIDVNFMNGASNTPLYYATFNNHFGIIKTLVAHYNIDINKHGGHYDTTALHAAAAFASLETVNLLISNDAQVNTFDKFQRTPLIYSIIYRLDCPSLPILNLLLQGFSDVNTTDVYGMSVLHYAALTLKYDTINKIIDAGGNIWATTNTKKTPLNLAMCSALNYRGPLVSNIEIFTSIKLLFSLIPSAQWRMMVMDGDGEFDDFYDFIIFTIIEGDQELRDMAHRIFQEIFVKFKYYRNDDIPNSNKSVKMTTFHTHRIENIFHKPLPKVDCNYDLKMIERAKLLLETFYEIKLRFEQLGERTLLRINNFGIILHFLQNIAEINTERFLKFYCNETISEDSVNLILLVTLYQIVRWNFEPFENLMPFENVHEIFNLGLSQCASTYFDFYRKILLFRNTRCPKLKHLCRASLRELLAFEISDKLPELIKDEELSDYCLFEEIDDIFKFETVSEKMTGTLEYIRQVCAPLLPNPSRNDRIEDNEQFQVEFALDVVEESLEEEEEEKTPEK
ncbi:hypothetical protein SNEBB_003626 [Seison nebaliae]|nr:hypothetical protein SNEBB_003626 [Seison nebaliae]